MSQMHRIGKTSTTVVQDRLSLVVTYHSTPVVHFDRRTQEVTLTTGGWMTATTKARMNQPANQYGLGFKVTQRAGDWYVTRTATGNGPREVPFTEGMRFKCSLDRSNPLRSVGA